MLPVIRHESRTGSKAEQNVLNLCFMGRTRSNFLSARLLLGVKSELSLGRLLIFWCYKGAWMGGRIEGHICY